MSAYVAINFRRQPRRRRWRWRQPLILHHLFLPILADGAIDCGRRRRRRAPLSGNDTRAIFAFYCGCGSLVWKHSPLLRISLHCLLAWIDIICDPACAILQRHKHTRPVLCLSELFNCIFHFVTCQFNFPLLHWRLSLNCQSAQQTQRWQIFAMFVTSFFFISS